MKVVTNIFSKLIYFIIIVVVIIITLNMFDKFKQSLTNNLYQCKVEFDSSGGTYIDTQTFKCGEKIENYSDPQKDGYVFEGWYLGEVQYNFDDIVVDDITLTAKWREKTTNDINIPVEKVSFASSTYQMKKTDSLKLEIKIEPANATNKNVYYTSSNESIATVNQYGIVTAKKSGSVEITVTTKDGGHKHTTNLIIISPVVGVKLNKEKVVLGLNDTYTLKATLTPTDPDNDKLTWSSSNPAVASVDKNGKVKAKAQGKAIITVTTVDGDHKATAEITVQKTVEKITLNKTSISLEKAKTANLTYSISPSTATDKTVNFTSSDKKVAIVDQNGKITAIGGGEATITVKSNDGNAKATCKVTVISKVTGISLSEKNIVIGKGGSKKLSATITPLDATNKNLEWSSSNSKKVKVDSTGKITGVTDGSATITVKTKDGSYTDKCTVTVKDLVLKIELDKTTATINKGATHTIKYKTSPSTATNKKVTFTSSNTSVATVDSTGKITGISSGKATITVKSNDGNASAKFTITVKVPLKGVSLNKTSLSLNKGESYSLTPTFNPTDATNKTVSWSSSNTKVATVNSSGKVTAIGTGTATITIKTKENNYKATTKVTVTNLTTKVTLNKTTVQLSKGESYKLSVTITPKDATNKTLTWTSSDSTVATVDSTGNVIAKKPGTTSVTVKTTNGKTATCKVNVTSISITSGSATIMDEDTYKLTATLTGQTGQEKVTWSSSDTNVATVDSTGKIKGKSIGTATITASITTSNNKKVTSNKFKITVRPIRILTVGNSKTYQSNLSTYIAKIAKKEGYSVEGITYNNYTANALKNYPAQDSSTNITYFRDTGGKMLKEVARIHKNELSQSFDYIVIQERTPQYSGEDYTEYYTGALNVLDIVYKKNPNIKMYIRKTWVLSTSSKKTIERAYQNTEKVVNKLKKSKGYNITIINDGPAFYNALSKNFNVLKSDTRHQTYLGGYLAASCIYSTLFNQDPTTIKYEPTTLDAAALKTMKSIAKSYCY